MEKQSTAWYVARRGELLAQQFLLDLQPDSVVACDGVNPPFDYIAFFTSADTTLVTVGIEVKATQQDFGGRYPFPTRHARVLLKSNIPVLVVVIDVKATQIYFNWIEDAIPKDKQALLDSVKSCRLQLRKSSAEELIRLRTEILGYQLLKAS